MSIRIPLVDHVKCHLGIDESEYSCMSRSEIRGGQKGFGSGAE